MEKKTIALYPFHAKRHNVYDSTIQFLLQHYALLYAPVKKQQSAWFTNLSRNPTARYLYHKLIRPFFSLNEVRALRENRQEISEKYDLIFSSNEIPLGNVPYVLDLENVIALSGYDYDRLDKKRIAEEFSKERCRAIICWDEIAYKSLVQTIDCTPFKKKIHMIPFAISSTPLQKNSAKKEIQLLFVSSINNPRDFEQKGGILALEAYARLVQKYPHLRFVVRAHIPQRIEKKYGHLPGLVFQKEFLSQEAMHQLFVDSDILLEPVPGIQLLLECMNFALPAVVFDFWMIPEMVIHGVNGFTVDCSSLLGSPEQMEEYLRNHHLRYLKLYDGVFDSVLIDDVVEKTEKLITKRRLREKMLRAAKSLVEKGGMYSLEKRNKELLRIFENALTSKAR